MRRRGNNVRDSKAETDKKEVTVLENERNDVKEILEKINKKNDDKISENDSLPTEFTFDFEADTGLVFEFVPEETVKPEAQKAPEKKAEKEEISEPKEEFYLPDVFEVSEKYNTPATPNTEIKIWTTYVPRFTEVSETYRMIGDTRPRSGGTSAERAQVKAVAADEIKTSDIDPTSDTEETVDSAVIVDMTKPSAEESDTLNVYKFSEGEQAVEEPRERTVEDERAEIESLIGAAAPEAEEIFEEIPEQPVKEAPVADAPAEKPKNYTIPDPVKEEVGAIEFTKETVQTPEDLPETLKRLGKDKPHRSEFAMPAERDSFKDKFLDSLMSIKIRFVAVLAFALLLCVFETFFTVGLIGDNLFGIPLHRTAGGVIDFLISAAVFCLALPELITAIKHILHKRVVPEIMAIAAFIILFLYTLTVVFSGGLIEYPLFGFMYTILVISAVFGAHLRTDADFTAFKLISRSKEKQVLDKKMTRSLPEENMALDGLVDEYKSRTARVFRAGFITDFFARSAKVSEKSSHTLVMLAVTGGVSLVTGVVTFFLSSMHWIPAMGAFTFVFLLGLPAFSILSHKLPYFHSQQSANADDSALIGERALFDFAKTDVITFEDTEIFGPDDVNLKRFMLYGDRDNMEKAMRQMCSLFSVVGGPLNFIFAGALDNRVRHSPAENPVIEEDGVAGDVGSHRICAGSEEYMQRHGITIPEGAGRSDAGIDTTKVMYAAEDGEVYAKFYIRYSLSEEFTMLLPALREEGIVPLVYTRDPNVSNELLSKLMAGSDCMRVVKKLTPHPGEDKVYNRLSAAIVTYGDKMDAINLILLSKKYKKLSDRLTVSELYAMGVGLALAVVLSLLGMSGVPSAIFGLWQISWCVVLHFVSKNAFLRDRSDDEQDTENK